jgi:hypothetical protein
MKNEIFGTDYNPADDNSLKNFEVLLAILRYLSRTKRPYNKRRIELLKQFLETIEQEGITGIFKSASFPFPDRINTTITDLQYFVVAKDYLRKISERFRHEHEPEKYLVDTAIFSHNKDPTYEILMKERKINRYFVYFMCNTLVMILIDNILESYFKEIRKKNPKKSISRSVNESSASPHKAK